MFWQFFFKSCQKRSRPFKRKNEFQPEWCLTEVKIKILLHIRVRRGQKPPCIKNQPIWTQSVEKILGSKTQKVLIFGIFSLKNRN